VFQIHTEGDYRDFATMSSEENGIELHHFLVDLACTDFLLEKKAPNLGNK
jgi:hypothetical protein